MPFSVVRDSATAGSDRDPSAPFVVTTPTIRALVARGMLRWSRGKRLVLAGGGKRTDYWRAELGAAGERWAAGAMARSEDAAAAMLARVAIQGRSAE